MVVYFSKLLSFVLIISFLGLSSCNEESSATTKNLVDTMRTNNVPSVTEQKFGTSDDGQDVIQYTLTNPAGMIVRIMNYGATITSIIVPDTSGHWDDVVLGFDSLAGYQQKENPYFGCVVGRYANRIAKGKFTLNGKTYQLPINNNGNTLHGGIRGFSKVVWTAKPSTQDISLKLTYFSKDGEEGFPGNCTAEVVYTLTPNNELKIQYSAKTDKPTVINLTNHSYFNLSAGKDSTILGHEVLINADRYTPVDDKLIPTGELPPVKGTAMDFNVPAKVGTDISKVAGGYDHNWVLNKKDTNAVEFAASLYHPGTGRYMEVLTTQPGVQFYTGNFLDGSLVGKHGRKYVKNGGLCFETQHFPDSPNQPSFPSTVLNPDETFRQITVYKFSTK